MIKKLTLSLLLIMATVSQSFSQTGTGNNTTTCLPNDVLTKSIVDILRGEECLKRDSINRRNDSINRRNLSLCDMQLIKSDSIIKELHYQNTSLATITNLDNTKLKLQESQMGDLTKLLKKTIRKDKVKMGFATVVISGLIYAWIAK